MPDTATVPTAPAHTEDGVRAHSLRASFPLGQALLIASLALLLLLLGWGLGRIFPGLMAPAPALAEVLGNAGEIMAAVLAIAITVVAIVVELAATRYSHRITALFLRARTNRLILSLFAGTAVLCIWATAMGSASAASQWLALGAMSLCLILLLPYFTYVLNFISPVAIISQLSTNALGALRSADAPASREAARRLLRRTVEDLQDVAHKAIEQSERSVALAASQALFGLLHEYRVARANLPASWFNLDESLHRDPDFISLEADALSGINQEGLWLELKLFRQLTALFAQAVPRMRDVAQVIAIRTRELAAEQPLGTAVPLQRLCLQAFNSYLRTSINARDPRTSYYLLSQYRALAQQLALQGERALTREIAQHFQYYGQLGASQQLPFLLEVAAYDLVHLIEACLAADGDAADLADALLERLLQLDQTISSDAEQPSLVGVRRAQLQLAARLLARGDDARARQIAADLAAEPQERLISIADALYLEARPQYWELTERGINFSYLEPEFHSSVEDLLALVAQQRS